MCKALEILVKEATEKGYSVARGGRMQLTLRFRIVRPEEEE